MLEEDEELVVVDDPPLACRTRLDVDLVRFWYC